MDDKNIWSFLYKELAKMNTVLESYDKVFKKINIKKGPLWSIFHFNFRHFYQISLFNASGIF